MADNANEAVSPPFNMPVTAEFDGAFSDGDVAASFHFSPDALREELANLHLLVLDTEETDEQVNNSLNAPDIGLQEMHESLPNIAVGGTAQNLQRDAHSRSSSKSPLGNGASSFEDLPISPVQSEQAASIYPSTITGTLDTTSETAESYTHLSVPSTANTTSTTSEPWTPKSEPIPSHIASPSSSSPGPLEMLPDPTPSLPRQSPGSVPANRPTMHRQARSAGPSTFEKVMSKTRPSFLPPKPKQEDRKHLAEWQNMMKMSQQAEKRRKAVQERRLLREKAVEESIHVWKKEIIPDWRVVHKKPALRKLWWHGIPTKLRAEMWERAVGNPLALSKDHYRTCLSRAKRALESGVFPEATLSLIEEDISTTLPSINLFNRESGPLYDELKDMLCAWVVSRSDEGLGYTVGAAKIAAMMSINMPARQGFNLMKNLLERHCLRSFYGGDAAREDVEAYYRIFDTLLADGMPKIYFNFKQHQISPAAYLPDWLLPLFLDHLPFEACARVWDVLLLEGDSFLYRAALGILAVLEPRLFFPERKELLELLKGENRAAIAVAQREGHLEGGKYEIYGVDEETLWERIESMDDWWKESTWTRLIKRELPDV